MKLKLTVTEEGSEPTEVLVINGGREEVAGELKDVGDSIEVEVGIPQAVVLREKLVR